MNILSLFDGIATAYAAIKLCGWRVDNYFACETDKYALRVAMNYPEIIQLGDIRKLDTKKLPHIDWVIAGSPCQGFSKVGLGKNFSDPRSQLFFEFLRILEVVKPTFFVLENVVMAKPYQEIISRALGVNPVMLDSRLVSGQIRKRLYWCGGFQAWEPPDEGVCLHDIIGQKAKVIQRSRGFNKGGVKRGFKSPTLTSHSWEHNNHLLLENGEVRAFTPAECENFKLSRAVTRARYRTLNVLGCWESPSL